MCGGGLGGHKQVQPFLSRQHGRQDNTQVAGQALAFLSRQGLGFSISKTLSVSPCLSQNRVGTNVRSNKVKGKNALTSPGLSLQ